MDALASHRQAKERTAVPQVMEIGLTPISSIPQNNIPVKAPEGPKSRWAFGYDLQPGLVEVLDLDGKKFSLKLIVKPGSVLMFLAVVV